MDTKGVCRASLFEFAQEDYLPVALLDRDVVIMYAWEKLLHFVQLVIVCGK